MTRRAALAGLLLAALLLVLPGIGQEHSGAPASESERRASGGSDMVGKIINSALLFGGLFFLLRKPLRSYLVERSEKIGLDLRSALEAKEAAERQLEETRLKSAALASEAARLKSEAEAEGVRAKERIRELAEKEADRLKTLARQEIEARLKAGIRELKAYAAGLAAGLAEARLKKRLTPADQAALIDRSIDTLKTLHEESDSR